MVDLNMDRKNRLEKSLAETSFKVIHLFDTIDSTNLFARDVAKTSAINALIVADNQTNGRGRFDRKWVSSMDSSILMSLLIHPEVLEADKMHFAVNLVAVSAIEVINDLFTLDIGLKWPNDIIAKRGTKLVDGTILRRDLKLGGLLGEFGIKNGTTQVEWIVIGTGINLLLPQLSGLFRAVNNVESNIGNRLSKSAGYPGTNQPDDAPRGIGVADSAIGAVEMKEVGSVSAERTLEADANELKNAIALSSLTNEDISKDDLIIEIIKKFDFYQDILLNEHDFAGISKLFRSHLHTLNREIAAYLDNGEVIEGKAIDISNEGNLLVETEVCIKELLTGDIVHLYTDPTR